MHEIIILWEEKGVTKAETIKEGQPSKNPGTVRLGREPNHCDITFNDPRISRLHAEIFYNNQHSKFYVRNLKASNLLMVDDQLVVKDGEVALNQDSVIYFGKTEVKIIYTNSTNMLTAPTILLPPTASNNNGTVLHSPHISQPIGGVVPAGISRFGTTHLVCPNLNCSNPDPQRLIPLERLNVGCSWCGTSLADAGSVFLPNNN